MIGEKSCVADIARTRKRRCDENFRGPHVGHRFLRNRQHQQQFAPLSSDLRSMRAGAIRTHLAPHCFCFAPKLARFGDLSSTTWDRDALSIFQFIKVQTVAAIRTSFHFFLHSIFPTVSIFMSFRWDEMGLRLCLLVNLKTCRRVQKETNICANFFANFCFQFFLTLGVKIHSFW